MLYVYIQGTKASAFDASIDLDEVFLSANPDLAPSRDGGALFSNPTGLAACDQVGVALFLTL
jgi:hypothetical protein